MKHVLFEYSDYRAYLVSLLGPKGTRTGMRGSLAKAIGCNTAYVSQVLNGLANFSLEQCEMINRFLGHASDECDYFFLLVQIERAGTSALKKYFQRQREEFLVRRSNIKQRLKNTRNISQEAQSKYYSAWYYSAVHMAVSIPELQNKRAIAEHFSLPINKVSEIFEFLIANGLVTEESGNYQIGRTHIHLGKDSDNILKHHTNWRTQAILSLERESIKDMHYSASLTLSTKDIEKIKNRLIESLKEITEIVTDSKEEEICCLNLDFFNLKRQTYSGDHR